MNSIRRTAAAIALALVSLWLPMHPAHAVASGSAGYAWADFDNDGNGDLAIGAPGESYGSLPGSGSVHVIYGSGSGLTASADQDWNQGSTGVEGIPESGDGFGSALSVGDFNGDGVDDLAIGVPGESIGTRTSAGVVQVLFGNPGTGLAAAGNKMYYQGTAAIPGSGEVGDRFGAALAGGDFDNDGISDLAVGTPGESLGSIHHAGVVNVLHGDNTGLSGSGGVTFSQDTPDIQGSAEDGDQFGFALVVGDFDGTGTDDLAIGVPYEDIGVKVNAGVVYAIRSGEGGLDSTTSDVMDQDHSLVAKQAHSSEGFGYALAAGNFDPSNDTPKSYDDLAVGVPGDNSDHSGSVDTFRGTETVLAIPGDEWYQGKGGAESGAVEDSHETGDGFGKALAANDFNGDNASDLAIGVPGEDFGAQTDAGAVNVLYSSGSGLDPANGPDDFWQQNTPGVTGSSEKGDIFGASVGSADFDGDGFADLTIGGPLEDVGTIRDCGALWVLYGSDAGIVAGGNNIWSEDTPGIVGAAETDDNFGSPTA